MDHARALGLKLAFIPSYSPMPAPLLYPALNLFSYPFSSKIALNSTRLAEDGAVGAAVIAFAKITEALDKVLP